MIQDPALIVTLLCDDAQPDGVAALIEHLGRPTAEGGLALAASGPDEWRNESQQTLLVRFRHKDVADLTLVQAALNAQAGAAGWSAVWEQAERALADLPAPAQEALLGRTLVYQAIAPAKDQMAKTAQTLLAGGALLSPDGRPFSRALARAEVSGGSLWLLCTPGEGRDDAVYLALGSESEQTTLVFEVLWGPQAALLWPDAVLHKANILTRGYLGGARRQRFIEAGSALIAQTAAHLQADEAPETGQLTALNHRIARLTTVSAELRRLHSALDIQRLNHERAAAHLGGKDNDLVRYQSVQIGGWLARVAHDIAEAQAALDAANTGLQSLLAHYERRQAVAAERASASERRTNYILAIIGVMLAVGQVIDVDNRTMLLRVGAMLVVGGLAIIVIMFLEGSRKDTNSNERR